MQKNQVVTQELQNRGYVAPVVGFLALIGSSAAFADASGLATQIGGISADTDTVGYAVLGICVAMLVISFLKRAVKP